MTHGCKNITLSQTSFVGGNKRHVEVIYLFILQKNMLHWIRPSQVQFDSSSGEFYVERQSVPEVVIQSPLPLSKGKVGASTEFLHDLWKHFPTSLPLRKDIPKLALGIELGLPA